MSTIYNFSAGPAVLPKTVLQQAQAEMLDWHGSGMSVMEMSHRGAEFTQIIDEALADLRELIALPANYHILFLQGGAQLQFSAVPMNLLRGKNRADYINTGHWSTLAIAEAQKYAQINVAASSQSSGFTTIPAQASWQLDPDAAYVHNTPNETIHGVEFPWIPETGDVPLVADMSSNILSRVMDYSRFGVVYAGAQKNIGPAGVTVVIVRDDLLGHVLPFTPKALDYKAYADAHSMYNTPSTYGIYLAGLVFKWLKANGGIAAMEALNRTKAERLYAYLDQSDFYQNTVAVDARSRMNVIFRLADEGRNADFLTQAKAAGLLQLKGHKALGGMRASIYNAMPLAGIDALIAFMRAFAGE